jgi:hypothetical protein
MQYPLLAARRAMDRDGSSTGKQGGIPEVFGGYRDNTVGKRVKRKAKLGIGRRLGQNVGRRVDRGSGKS